MQTSECPDDEVLASWAMQGRDHTDVREHIAGCATCRTVVAELARTTGARPPVRRLGRYELEREVGAGGMGVVFAAWDPVVQRKVALKLLHEPRAHDGGQRAQRFLREREVLGGFEHPHIARLLDAGETDDGRPWFVMDFIDGLPLDAWCERHRLTMRQRLELLFPVFSAVSAAHQRLVVHRDLKPANILVNAEGLPQLVDFGIARLLEDQAALTHTGLAPMTPAYASPEQVRREPATVTSDLYSLGVVMYELLTGVSPYLTPPGDLQALLGAITREEPTPPSAALARASDAAVASRAATRTELRRALEGDLDAIVLMALRKEPTDRYPSVDAFAQDVRAALDGLPTRARRGGTAYRAARFVRRHRALVAGLTAAFVALLAGLAGTLWQAARAERERDVARARFQQVRSLARAVLFDYHDGIVDLPGSTVVRERLARDASAYLAALSAEASDDVTLRSELATAWLKLGDVQGDPFSASLGDTAAAKTSYLRGRALAQSVLAQQPADRAARRMLAASFEKEGALVEVSSDLSASLALYEQARALDLALHEEQPGDADQRLQLSRDELAMAQVLLQLGRAKEAARWLDSCLVHRRALLGEHPDDPRLQRAVAVVFKSIADLRADQGRFAEAIAAAEEGEALGAKLVAAGPESFDALRLLNTMRARLSELYRLGGQLQKAVTLAELQAGVDRKTLAADPGNATAQRDLVVSLSNLVSSLNAADQPQRAADIVGELLALQRRTLTGNPENQQAVRDLVFAVYLAGNTALERGVLDEAEAHYREVLALEAKLRDASALNQAVSEQALGARNRLGLVLERRGRFDDALREMGLGLAGLEALVAQSPDNKRNQSGLFIASVHEARVRLTRAERLTGLAATTSRAEACARLQRALEHFSALRLEGTQTGNSQDELTEALALRKRCP
jgi:tetratricopeptide (TPR) repeat protein